MIAAWRDESLRQKIEYLLDSTFDLFKGTLEEIQKSADELKTKLGIRDGQQSRPDYHRVIEELKRVHFIVKKTEFFEIIDKIREGVTNLNALLNFAIAEEPRRRKRSQGRLVNLVRDTSNSIYRALRSNFSCGSGCTHQVHLGLESRSSSIMEMGNTKSQSLSFQLAVNYRAIDTATKKEDSSNDQLLWKGLLMQTLQSNFTFGTVPIRCQPDNNQAGQKTESLVKETQEYPAQMRLYGGQTTTIELQSSNRASTRPAINLCKEIRAGPKSKDIACYGIIADSLAKSAEFEVFPQTDLDGANCSTVSLHQILQARGNGLPCIFKLRLAAKISSSFFQLHSTPWLPGNLSSRQILFIKTGEFINFEKAFVMMSFPESDSGSTGPASMDHGAALRCLGVVLIELEYEETIESLRRTHNTTPRSIYSAEIEGMLRLYGDATIDRLIRTRNWVGNYGRVVNLCMNGHHGTIDLNDKELRQEIYESIVQPLEVDWNLSTFRIPKLNS
ncbi:hypothetical protein CGGC5_v009660 [Colletotrichum fructicola Nara gc5]|uniref:DUF7580 domain-containing protein n=1 Tax=Colletotrichum fructicola (strain Nara gc5) TaxID=1213859 RepID=A0A7J6J0A1_COLFN|nr:hypothetical protein CGGC5_v009660 [Colletotrichum fructicola Nara gc5]